MKLSSISKIFLVTFTALFIASCSSDSDAPVYDVIITNGIIYDGTGGVPYKGDVALNDGYIAAVGNIGPAVGRVHINAEGKAIAPGFINMLSWATDTIIEDGRSMGDIKQGVTLEVFGEGWSMGPFSEATATLEQEGQGDIKFDITWRTLGGYLEYLEEKGVSPNVASFVGATTVRINTIGFEDRAPTPDELSDMQAQVRQAMEEGALGVGSSLIYAPAFYAKTDELIALNQVAAEYGGMYISHIRSEGNKLLEAVEELITISAEANIPAEIYHLKAAGAHNWYKMDEVIARVEQARANGQRITADMYNYIAGATGLDAAMPPWVQEGGYGAWAQRLQDPEVRARVKAEMGTNADDWESFYYAAGPDKMILSGFKNPELRHYTGKTLTEVAAMRGTSPEDTAMDLVVEDGSRVGVIYFLMTEENMHKKIAQPWVSFGSDAGSMATEGVFLNSSPHPRAYGNFSRLLGKYVREEGVISLEEAIRRLTSQPAQNLSLRSRGGLIAGYHGDVVVFDPDMVGDRATFSDPHQYAVGMEHVFVNGEQVLSNGEHTGKMPGQVVRGPGWLGWEN
ncbi:MAG: D-aminoacylase [Sphingomonadales bacterium]|nr:D-aminoacylase [Sphingomonadales bacterium]